MGNPTYEQSVKDGGFVFIDERPWPYLVSKINGGWWLYYWADGRKNFVTLRKLSPEDIERFRPIALSEDQARLYFELK